MQALLEQLADPFCHQMPERTLVYGGELQVFCARCTGLYVSIGLCLAWFLVGVAHRRRLWLSRGGYLLSGLGVGACVLDGALGLSHELRLANEWRFVLGFIAGSGIGMVGATWVAARVVPAPRAAAIPSPWRFALVLFACCALLLSWRANWIGVAASAVATLALYVLLPLAALPALKTTKEALVRAKLKNTIKHLVLGVAALTSSGCEMTIQRDNPLLDALWFQAFLGMLVCVVGLSLVLLKASWNGEVKRVRLAILEHLGLPESAEGRESAREAIRALIPCEARDMSAPFDELRKGRVWLCFLEGELLAVDQRGTVTALPRSSLKKLHLMRDTGAGPGLAIEVDEGMSTLAMSRLDDMVRIVNVLVEQGVVLRNFSAK